MPRKQRLRLTAAEFEAVRPLLDISDDRIEAARRALVDGETLTAAGKRFGWSRQYMYSTVGTVFKTHERSSVGRAAAMSMTDPLPKDWDEMTVRGPSAMLASLVAKLASVPGSRVEGGAKAKETAAAAAAARPAKPAIAASRKTKKKARHE